MEELELRPKNPTTLFEDITGATNWALKQKRSKHVEIKYHFIRELVTQGVIKIAYCPTENMEAHIMTKAFNKKRFEKLRTLLGVTEIQLPRKGLLEDVNRI